MSTFTFIQHPQPASFAQLENFQNELHLLTKLLVAKHFPESNDGCTKTAVKIDDLIWHNSLRLTQEVSDLL